MDNHFRALVLALAAAAQVVATSARAQAADSLTKVKAEGSIAIASAPVDTAVKKKGGMFGKLKSVAHNKTIQSITKAAVCQALPGGQYMVGAAEAAKNKTSVASGVANAQSCIPGMGGAGVGGLGGKGALAGAAMGAAGSLGAGTMGKAAPGATKGMPGMPAMPGGAGAITASAQGIAGMQSAMAQMQAASIATGGTGTGAMTTEAPGEQMKLSGAVPDEIKKGKLTIKKIDWVYGNPSVSPSTAQGFMDLMLSAGQAMKGEGARYRVDVYMDKKYSDEDIAALGAERMSILVTSLQSGGQLGDALVAGKIGKDKEQRVEIVRVK